MEKVEFFSKLATKIGFNTIAERGGVTHPTVSKILGHRAYQPKKRQPAKPLVLDALHELAIERVSRLRREAQEIEDNLPELIKWKAELTQV